MANDNSAAAAGAPSLHATGAVREIPDAVQWHEGMLLSPQHFQLQDARTEALLQATVQCLHPYGWGVQSLQLDLAGLPMGIFRVRQVEAIFPDGTLGAFAGGEGQSLEINLAAAAEAYPDQTALNVYLAVPRRTAASAQGEFARFRSAAGEPVADENTGEGGVEVPRLQLCLRLFAGEAPTARFSFLPLARVGRRDDAFELLDYAPPVTSVGFDSPLYQMAAAVALRLRTKALRVAEQVRSPAVSAQAAVVWEGKRQLQCLVAGLPALEAVLGGGRAHPFAIYLALCGVAGQVTALAHSLQPPLLPPYRHDDPGASLAAARDFILRAVDEGVSDTYLAVPLRPVEGGYEVMFNAEWMPRRLALGLRRPPTASENDILAWGQQCLVGSEDVLSGLREKRVLGLRRRALTAADELTAGPDMVLFELSADPALLKPDRPLRVEHPGRNPAAGPADVVLYIRNADL